MRFEWDEWKNQSNIRKHGVAFETAAFVFRDPFYVMDPEREVDGEQRWQTIGMVGGVLMLMVAHTIWDDEEEQEEVVRIISAREATAQERRRYEDGA